MLQYIKRLVALTILMCVLVPTASAQLQDIDSIIDNRWGVVKFAESHIGQATLMGGALIVGGQFFKSKDDKFRKLRTEYMPTPEHSHDYYLQVVPAAIMLGLKGLGVKSESTWPQMLVADAASLIIMSGTVEALKHTADEWRPDGSDEHSFPSGHTATAFMTATMLHHEYGSRYPWLSVLGYGLATTTGFLRVHDNRHWVGDVTTGAGIGIISTELGYIVSDLIFHRPILKNPDYFRNVGTDYCPTFLSYYVSIDGSTSSFKGWGGRKLKFSNGSTIGLEGAWFPMPYLGIGGRATYSDFKFYADEVPQSQPIRYTSALVGIYNSSPFSSRLALGLKIIGGYGRYDAMEIADAQGVSARVDSRGGFTFSSGAALIWRVSEGLSYRIFADVSKLPRMSADADRCNITSFGAQVAVNF